MKRFDLRHLKNDFAGRLKEILNNELQKEELIQLHDTIKACFQK